MYSSLKLEKQKSWDELGSYRATHHHTKKVSPKLCCFALLHIFVYLNDQLCLKFWLLLVSPLKHWFTKIRACPTGKISLQLSGVFGEVFKLDLSGLEEVLRLRQREHALVCARMLEQ